MLLVVPIFKGGILSSKFSSKYSYKLNQIKDRVITNKTGSEDLNYILLPKILYRGFSKSKNNIINS